MTPVKPRVTLITVTYNSEAVVGRMLEPFSSEDEVEIVVVDNGSVDGSTDLVRRVVPDATLLECPDNPGFAVAVNRGADAATGTHLLLLNPDARISLADMWSCVELLEREPTLGVVAPHVQHPLGRRKAMEAGRDATNWRMFNHWSGLSRLSGMTRLFEGMYLLDASVRASRDVDWVSGACLFVRTDVWRQLGGMSERWFMYAEDIEFCLRVLDAGFRVRLHLDARAEHAIGNSSASASRSSISSAWLLNLYDLYKLRHRPSLVQSWCWRALAAAGMRSRWWGYRAKARRAHDSRVDWSAEADKYRQHARAIAHARLR